MPLYRWKDKGSGKAVEILRSFEEYQDTPDREEALAGGLTEEEIEVAEWIREIGAGIQLVRGANWNGSKGNWIIMLAFMGGYGWIYRFLDMLL